MMSGDSFSTIVLALLTLSTGIGFLGLVATWAYRDVARSMVEHYCFRFVTYALAALSTLPVVYRSFAQEEKREPWLVPSVLGVVSVALWQALQVRGEYLEKRATKKGQEDLARLKGEHARAVSESYRRTRALVIFRKLVEQKRQRVAESLRTNGCASRKITTAEVGLCPRRQIDDILRALLVLLRELLPQSEKSEVHNFRAAFYVEQDGHLALLHGVGDENRSEGTHSSWKNYKDRFRLSNQDKPTRAVRCIQENRLLIVPDCEQAEKEGTFEFFKPDQRHYLKSLAAHPVTEVIGRKGEAKKAALVVDTDVACFFSEENEVFLRLLLSCFAARLSLEVHLDAMVAPR